MIRKPPKPKAAYQPPPERRIPASKQSQSNEFNEQYHKQNDKKSRGNSNPNFQIHLLPGICHAKTAMPHAADRRLQTKTCMLRPRLRLTRIRRPRLRLTRLLENRAALPRH